MESIAAAVGIYAATAIAAVLSGLVPIVNAEIYLISAVLLTGDPVTAVILGIMVAVGQMLAKIVLYQAARKATDAGTGRFAVKLRKARTKVEQWRSKPLGITFLSALTGLPPFYLVSLVAGILEIRFLTFLWIGLLGRGLRFVTIALLVVYW